MIDYVICEPRGYPKPLSSRHRSLMPERVWLTQWNPQLRPPFMVNATGLDQQRIFIAMSCDTIIAAHNPADILRLIHIPGVDLRSGLDTLKPAPAPATARVKPQAQEDTTAHQPPEIADADEQSVSNAILLKGIAAEIKARKTPKGSAKENAEPSTTHKAEPAEPTKLTGRSSIGNYLKQKATVKRETKLP